MTQIFAYIHFEGNCREAMTFYRDCLGGELNMQTVEGSAIEGKCTYSMKDKILHASLAKGAMLVMASDCSLPGGIAYGNNVALSVNCSSEEEINRFYNKLSEGGEIIDPLKTQFWGATYGVISDKFGIRWMFNYDKNQK